jgi:aminoglycoside 3-N-acetyltransferase
MNMKELFQLFKSVIDREWLEEHVVALTEIERGQTFKSYAKAADYVHSLLLENGFPSEKVRFPADGKTVYQDKRMPLAWDASTGRITIKSSPIAFTDPVVADFSKDAFALIKHSVATPTGGIVSRLVTEPQVLAGEDCTGAMVLLEPTTPPRPPILKMVLDLGAMGIVSEFLTGGLDTPDSLQWVTACTEGNNWHVQSEDREFIGFSVTPRVGQKLRQAVNTGEVSILVESDGRRYEGDLYGVTSLIPGKQAKELWITAHLYEPLINDNSSGVIGAIEIVRQLRHMIDDGTLPPLEFSIRLVFAMEMYGFAAFADYFGGNLRGRAIGSINMDALPNGRDGSRFSVTLAPPAVPFFGNYLMEDLVETYQKDFDNTSFQKISDGYCDDLFLSDSTTGLPGIWPMSLGGKYWHNSIKNADFLDMDKFVTVEAFIAAWVTSTATLNTTTLPKVLKRAVALADRHLKDESIACQGRPGTDQRERMDYLLKIESERIASFRQVGDIPEICQSINCLKMPKNILPVALKGTSTPWFDYAATIIPSRVQIGFPYDLIKIPKEERISLPDGVIYGPFARILANMDGRKNLCRILEEAEWETRQIFDEKKVKKYLNAIMYLAEAGYLKVQAAETLNVAMISDALKRLGINKNELLLVHSSNSGLGYINGGANAIINGIKKAVGAGGTFLMPTFTRPYLGFEGRLNKGMNYRPYDPSSIDQVCTGQVPRTLLKRHKVLRSAHVTHSWAGLGKLAAACLNEHQLLDPPAAANSPMGKALSMNAKLLYFGCDINASTFIHFLEDQAKVPFLENAVVKIRTPSGRFRTEIIPRHFSGHRDFYKAPAIESKFFQRAVAGGLEIRNEKLGLGTLYLIELKQFYEIGMRLFAEDPAVSLCDNSECRFCQSYR